MALAGPTIVGGAVAAGMITLFWPELALPIILLSSPLLDNYFGGERVRHLVFIKLVFFACAALGVFAARLRGSQKFSRVRTPADLPALALVGYTALSAGYSYFLAGYDLDRVAVAGYHLSQLALYHFLVTITLSRFADFRRAGLMVLIWSALWIIPNLFTPGRHGAEATTWLLILLCYTLVKGKGKWELLIWILLPLALLSTLTSGYRTLWVCVAGQIAWLLVLGLTAKFRRLAVVAGTLLGVGVFSLWVILISPEIISPIPAAVTLQRFEQGLLEGGYRTPEALAGLEAFSTSPILGRGIGYQTPIRYIDTMGYMPVGPIYHVYYVSYLANEGLLGLALVFWYFGAALLSAPARRLWRLATRNPWAALGLGLQAALVGTIFGAFFSGPNDGYWTWGILGGAALLPAIWLQSKEANYNSPPVSFAGEPEAGLSRE